MKDTIILADIDEDIGIYSTQLELYHDYEERYLENQNNKNKE